MYDKHLYVTLVFTILLGAHNLAFMQNGQMNTLMKICSVSGLYQKHNILTKEYFLLIGTARIVS